MSEELIVKNFFEVIEASVEKMSREEETFEKECDSSLDDYCKIDVEEKEKYRKIQLVKLLVHMKTKKVTSTEVLEVFDALNFYPSARWSEH